MGSTLTAGSNRESKSRHPSRLHGSAHQSARTEYWLAAKTKSTSGRRTHRRPPAPRDTFRRLPLGSLRVFVAVAEHMHFTRAAEALGVTVSAASMQIQALEQYLGVALFRRQGRLISITEQGAQLLPKIRDGLTALQDAI